MSLRKGGGFGAASCLRSSWMLGAGVGAVGRERVGMQRIVALLPLIALAGTGSAEVY